MMLLEPVKMKPPENIGKSIKRTEFRRSKLLHPTAEVSVQEKCLRD
jgi:hypothetical protein